MTTQDVKAEVRGYLLENFAMGEGAAIADDASFMEEHILDSTGFVELVAFLEATYGIKVGDAEMLPENLDSLVNIEAFVARKRAAA
jgi:acyl carrier protein